MRSADAVGNEICYEVDGEDRLVYVSSNWDGFAVENQVYSLAAQSVRTQCIVSVRLDTQ